MKTKKISLCCLLGCLFISITSCQQQHMHKENDTFTYDEEYHYKECLDCHEIIKKEEHQFVENNEEKICKICNYNFSLSQEKLFLEWVKGRDYFKTYDGGIEYDVNFDSYIDDVLSYKYYQEYSKSGNQYYNLNETYSLNEKGKLEKNNYELEVVKNVVVDGLNRTKRYFEVNSRGNITKECSYISPNYSKEKDDDFDSLLSDFSIDKGDSYKSFLNEIKDNFLENDDGKIKEITFVKKDDDSIDLFINSYSEEIDEYIKEDDYKKTIYDRFFYFNVKDGKLNSLSYKYKEKEVYANKEINRIYDNEYVFIYKFNNDKFNSFSIETDKVENYYYSSVVFVIEGYTIRYSDKAYVYEEYSSLKAKEYLCSLEYVFISSISKNCFDIYLDQEYKRPFTKQYIENDDNFVLYVKLSMDEDKAAVVTVFQNQTRSWVYLIYIVNINSTFRAGSIFSEYPILSIDGKKWNDGDSTDIACNENKAYVVVFDTPNLIG